jgi:hypothetical protein
MKHPSMKTLRTSIYALVVSSLLAVGAKAQPNTSAPVNLLVAGDFEGITTADLKGYGAPTTGVWGTEAGAISGAANGITPFSGSQMLQIQHSGGGTQAQTNQVVYGPFKAGSVVTFSVRFNTWRTPDGYSSLVAHASIMTDTGIALDGTRYMSPDLPLTVNKWQTASVTVTLPSDTNYLSAEILVTMNSNGAYYGTPLAYADDAVLTVAPHINWVNWTGTDTSSGITKYVGQMVVPRTSGGSTTVIVKYTPPT